MLPEVKVLPRALGFSLFVAFAVCGLGLPCEGAEEPPPEEAPSSRSSWANYIYICNKDDLAGLELLLAVATSGYPTPQNNSDCCANWNGIECSSGRVTAINVPAICGTLPDELYIPYLASLSLGPSACLGGSLPSRWSNMTIIDSIRLSETNISGTLPQEWSGMKNLVNLYLFQTPLSGTLPMEWSALQSIQYIFLYGTGMSGTLPGAWSKLKTLVELAMYQTAIGGTLPTEWQHMKSLRRVSLSQTSVSGSLPMEWGETNLESLDVGHSRITGTLPSSWALQPISRTLRTLSLYQANLDGTLPPSWANMTSLALLDVTGNKLVGSIPPEWGNGMPSLEALVLADNGLNGTLPQDMMPNLMFLDFSANNLSGAIPLLARSKDLFLYADGNGMINTLPENGESSIVGLSLSNTGITNLPMAMATIFPRLRYISIEGLRLTEIPALADVPGIVIAAAHNIINLSSLHLKLRLSAPQNLDFSPKELQPPVDFSTMCGVNCSVTGPYKAQHTSCPMSSASPFLCFVTDQQYSMSYPREEFQGGNFTTPVQARIFDFNRLRFLDLTCPSVTSAVFVPRLVQLPIVDAPSAFLPPAAPQWDGVPIPFPSTGAPNLAFAGLQSAQLLHGVQYRLVTEASVNGILMVHSSCTALPHLYSLQTDAFSLAPCDYGLLGVNFTQRCVACPQNALCDNTRIFADPSANVWRPSYNTLPFAECLVGSTSCRNDAEAPLREGFECSTGYTGPLCGVCADGFGKSTAGSCDACYSTGVNLILVVGASLASFAVISYVVVAATAATSRSPSSSSRSRLIGQQAVKLLTNHFSLFAVLVSTAVAAAMRSELRAALAAQGHASSPSPTGNIFVSCLFPRLTANDEFAVVTLAVPVLAGAQIVMVRVVHQRWEFASVAAIVLQLTYMQVVNAASKLLRNRQLTFYDSTRYLAVGAGDGTGVVASFNLLDADLRIDFATNDTHYCFAWLVLVGFGGGVPIWFAVAYLHARREFGTAAGASRKLRFLVGNYQASSWYWESIVAIRKGLSVVLVVALFEYPVLQLHSLMVLFVMYVVAEERYNPFLSRRRRAAELTSYAAALFTCNAMLAVYIVDSSSAAFSIIMVVLMLFVQIAAVAVYCRILFLDATAGVHGQIDEGSSSYRDDVGEMDMCSVNDETAAEHAGRLKDAMGVKDEERSMLFSRSEITCKRAT